MRKKIFNLEFWMVAFLFSCCGFTNAEENDKNRQTFVIRYKDGEQTIPVTVVLDYKKQTEYVLNMNPRSPAKSVTLYDFKQRTIAYKDLANNECFLGRLTHETLSEESHALKDLKIPVEGKPKVRSLYPGRPALTPTEIRNIAGQKTAAFCGKMNTWLLMPEKGHGISKREADDDYEERTYHHHGYHTVQYSHFGRETRRRHRNPHKPRSHRTQSAAGKQGLVAPEETDFSERHQPSTQLSKTFNLDSNVPNNGIETDTRNHLRKEMHTNPPIFKNLNENSNFRRNIENSSSNNGHSYQSPVSKNNFGYQIKYPNFEAEFSSAYRIPSEAKSNNNSTDTLNFGHNGGNQNFNSGKISDHLKLSSAENKSLVSVTPKEFSHVRTARATSTTDLSTDTHDHDLNYPDVHPSLVHLLPLYKPLSREFEFDPPIAQENTSFTDRNQLGNHQRNIESEFDPLSPHNIQPNTIFHDSTNNRDLFENSDVSTNVLEIPKITKQFENVRSNESFGPHLDIYPNISKSHNQENRSEMHSNTSLNSERNIHVQNENSPESGHLFFFPNRHRISAEEEIHLEEDVTYIPPLEILSTTESSTSLRYLAPERSFSNEFVSVHRASNKNAAIPFPHVIPNYISNNDFNSIPSENNLNVPAVQGNQTRYFSKHSYKRENLENSFNTTEKSFKEEAYKANFNHRSDIPSEDRIDGTLTSDLTETDIKGVANKTNSPNLSAYKIRYQSVLRDFKPDEIVIDIENIPTPSPPLVTSRFQQRIFTTIQPTVKSFIFDSVRSDTSRRSEQTLGTTWHSYVPTTRHPRKRIHNRTRKPAQNELRVPVQRSQINQNHQQFQSRNLISQRNGVSHFNPTRQTTRQRIYRPAQTNPPPILMPSQSLNFNQPRHFNQLNNLPPGVSVHPRHPQAPFADMVRSNRPPTMPVLEDNQILKHHRHRHQRKKDRSTNSCCRLHGKPGSFQNCCRNGGHCCSGSQRRMQTPGSSCCSSPRGNDQVIPPHQIQSSHRPPNRVQPPIRASNPIQQPLKATNHLQLPLKTESMPRSAVNDKDRCEKEKMCRTVYESTQKVMVCRNAHIEGC